MFKAHDIGYFFYNGGNDSADTCLKVSQIAETLGYPLTCDRTCRRPSTTTCRSPTAAPASARSPSTSRSACREAGFDVASMAQDLDQGLRPRGDGPPRRLDRRRRRPRADEGRRRAAHPAVPRDRRSTRTAFLAAVKRTVDKHGYCTVVVSEGLHGRTASSSPSPGLNDAFGHAQLGGVAPAHRASWSRTSSATSTTGRSPTTCSARRATSPRRPTSSRPTPSARPRSSCAVEGHERRDADDRAQVEQARTAGRSAWRS